MKAVLGSSVEIMWSVIFQHFERDFNLGGDLEQILYSTIFIGDER